MPSETGLETPQKTTYELRPVGDIHRSGEVHVLAVFPEYRQGLTAVEGFSHLWVLYWFHENDEPASRSILQVHPRKDPKNPLTGVFGTRSHMRPNLIGMDLCRIEEVRQPCGEIVVSGCQARDGTPLVDIKPYLPYSDSAREVRLPEWAGKLRHKELP